MDWQEACNILGVKLTATQEEILEQYRYKAQLLHPDKNQNKPEYVRKKAEEELKLVNRAYDYLKNPSNNPFVNPPKLKVTPKRIRFSDVDLDQKKSTTILIENIGGAYTNIWIDDQPSRWLVSKSVRSVDSEQLPLELTIECTGLGDPGSQYRCELIIRLENENTKIRDEIALEIELWIKEEAAILAVDTSRIEFNQIELGSTQIRKFEISNLGRGVLKGKLSSDKSWIQVLPDDIYVDSLGKEKFTVSILSSGLFAGYTDKCTLNIITNGGSYQITVDVSIAVKPIDTPIIQTPQKAENVVENGFSFGSFIGILFASFLAPIMFGVGFIPFLIWEDQRGLSIFLFLLWGIIALTIAIKNGIKEGKKTVFINTTKTQPINTSYTRKSPINTASSQQSVIANSFRSVYHKPSCEWARKMSPHNREYITKDEARRRGYKPCRICRP